MSKVITVAEANNKILQVNNICQQIINIFLEEKVFGWSDYHNRPFTYYFQGFQDTASASPWQPVPGMVFISSYRWVTDYTESEEIMVPASWLDDFNEPTVRKYAKALASGKRLDEDEEKQLEAVRTKLSEIKEMKMLMGKYPDAVNGWLKGQE